jgi:ectoine hydroxylase-related dioxygenase (phytanoyl-CoA dioxygenase family)
VSILAKAGDAYLFNNQVWHRGAPNVSDRVRYLGGVTYSKRFVSQKLYPFIDYRMPEHVWEGADERLQRLLGRHKPGAYG